MFVAKSYHYRTPVLEAKRAVTFLSVSADSLLQAPATSKVMLCTFLGTTNWSNSQRKFEDSIKTTIKFRISNRNTDNSLRIMVAASAVALACISAVLLACEQALVHCGRRKVNEQNAREMNSCFVHQWHCLCHQRWEAGSRLQLLYYVHEWWHSFGGDTLVNIFFSMSHTLRNDTQSATCTNFISVQVQDLSKYYCHCFKFRPVYVQLFPSIIIERQYQHLTRKCTNHILNNVTCVHLWRKATSHIYIAIHLHSSAACTTCCKLLYKASYRQSITKFLKCNINN